MPRFRFGFPTRLLGLPLRESVGRAAALGADGVEFDLRGELPADSLSATGRRQLRHLMGEHRLEAAPASFPLRRPIGDETGLEARVAALSEAFRLAGDLRIPGVLLRPGVVPAAGTAEGTIFREVLGDLARVGDHVGVMPLLATGRETADTWRELLESVTSGPIGLAWDPSAAVMGGSEVDSIMRALPDAIRQVRLRDGFREADGAGVETAVGRGEVDWEQVLALLAEADYRHWITPDRTSGEDPAGDAARAITYVRRVLPF